MTKPTRVVPKVAEAVPPLAIGRIPETSEELRLTEEILSSPLILLTIPLPREVMVVEPLWLTVSKLAPVEETMAKGLTADVPWMVRVAVLVVVPTESKLETVVEPVTVRLEPELFQTKLPLDAVVLAPVA
jgi:hypothetical protein